jgi:hypothetical protein
MMETTMLSHAAPQDMKRAMAALEAAPAPNQQTAAFCAAWDEIDLEEGNRDAAKRLVRDAERYRAVIRESRGQWPSLWRYVVFRAAYALGDPVRVLGERKGWPRLIDLGCDIVWFGFQVRDRS